MHFSEWKGNKSQVCEPLVPSPPLPIPISSQVHLLMGSSCKGWRTRSHKDAGRNVCGFSSPTGRGGAWNWIIHHPDPIPEPVVSKATELTCLSAISGFPPPFCELGIKSPVSALAPPFPILHIVFLTPNLLWLDISPNLDNTAIISQHPTGQGQGCTSL